ncbi:MAG: hypothetical protein LBT43_21425 [Prevotella sp.]|nr:hypothetical protein [Prevotella sp.]
MYNEDISEQNRESFLQVIKDEYARTEQVSDRIADIAYEIVSGSISKNPDIVSELSVFNKDNRQFSKDAMRFKY